MSRISFCNDSGGSIRIPAHFCGVFGFKASLGGINSSGIIGQVNKKIGRLNMRTLLSTGMMAQSVGDIKMAMNVIGTERLTPTQQKEIPANKIKLLWINELPEFEVDNEIKKVFGELRTKLSESGVSIDTFSNEQFNFSETIRISPV